MPANLDELVVRVADICTYKWDMVGKRPLAFLISSFAGGAMVVFGATLALSVSAGVGENLAPGLANLLMGLVFMFSLVIIMMSGMTLVTADMYIGIVGVFHKRITWGSFMWGILLGYIGNFIGSMFFMWLIGKSGAYAAWPWMAKSHAIAVAKTGYGAIEIFVMGIVCTWMLQTAAILFVKAEGDMARIAMAAYGPLAFVAGMTEHCIANIGFLALPLFQQEAFLEAAGRMGLAAPVILHWGFGQYGWAHNQLYTLLGNIVGGILFVGIPFQLVSNPKRVEMIYRSKTSFMGKL
ncbi:formate/nitrite transporter family protein [Pseudodesulfovibrio thermohalotolerans]|uniref:formate/nitrite transporter family protein n=1 Tax=Pseudodesulfovibrio thermohalotolerans TaxID=2880651 RepID=UPI002441B8D6|nr:formate/nitrite transporter family protein [Pseudodesulfovibrio thermohalotolerans]WFS63947.1 formate/nitrite transporter family protein [Pseudodesulfovibrio thermohalotolerans]